MYRPLEKLLKSKCALSFCSYSFRNIILPKISVIFTVKLPLYSLFQSDRKNSDGDNEVQDPLKEAVKQILNDAALKAKFDEIATEKSLTPSPFEMTLHPVVSLQFTPK